MRSDVRRNRRLILDTARELFAAGEDASLYRIAQATGIGQATLYRHFRDRSLLAAALSEEILDELEQASQGAETFEQLLGRAAETAARLPGLRRMMLDGEAAPRLAETRRRLRALFEEPLRAAKRAGRVDEQITTHDVLLVTQMIEGGLSNAAIEGSAERRQTSERITTLALRALAPRSPNVRGRDRSSQ